MTYTQKGEEVILQMNREDFSELMSALGVASGFLYRNGDKRGMYRIADLVNRLNQGNPAYAPFEVFNDICDDTSI